MTNESKTTMILNHVIKIKEDIAGIKQHCKNTDKHLKTLNGSLEKHEVKIENNENRIGNIRITMAKWGGAIAAILIILQFGGRYIWS